ncbi:RING-H2 finger protein ATL39-like [Triticum dicoccoides]|uniref:RING-H2 finger protein ATL39-like n=1 Tax=Triticum dicoccoides TaxID=85692 RepID=UPI00188EB20D|nr:RING-H2 finger protein ATL39-like [Triticum dicoccoides]
MGAPDTSWVFADLAVADSSRYSTRSRLLLTGLSFAIAVLTILLYLAISYACRRRRRHRCCRRQRGAGAGAGAVDQEAGMSDAAIVYEQADAEAAPMDCAVCLGEVEAGEKLRRLPKCAHLFHADCVHASLQAHSTCPMCRAATTPAATAAAEAPPPAVVAGTPPALERMN